MEVKPLGKHSRTEASQRRVSSATKEPIPADKLNVLERNFKQHNYVSPEVRAACMPCCVPLTRMNAPTHHRPTVRCVCARFPRVEPIHLLTAW